jgi:hypothetical protein
MDATLHMTLPGEQTRNGELSADRLYAMKALYLLTGIGLGLSVWPEMIHPRKPWDPLDGVAFSFWAALSLLMLLGVRFPVRMLPLMLLQLFYKLTCLVGVGYPLWSAGHLDPAASELIKACAIGAALDLIVIPWPYVLDNYVKAIFTGETKHEALSP